MVSGSHIGPTYGVRVTYWTDIRCQGHILDRHTVSGSHIGQTYGVMVTYWANTWYLGHILG